MSGNPLERYEALVEAGEITRDPVQLSAIQSLERLHEDLQGYRPHAHTGGLVARLGLSRRTVAPPPNVAAFARPDDPPARCPSAAAAAAASAAAEAADEAADGAAVSFSSKSKNVRPPSRTQSTQRSTKAGCIAGCSDRVIERNPSKETHSATNLTATLSQ